MGIQSIGFGRSFRGPLYATVEGLDTCYVPGTRAVLVGGGLYSTVVVPIMYILGAALDGCFVRLIRFHFRNYASIDFVFLVRRNVRPSNVTPAKTFLPNRIEPTFQMTLTRVPHQSTRACTSLFRNRPSTTVPTGGDLMTIIPHFKSVEFHRIPSAPSIYTTVP